ncbi:MAG: hypothetical protein Q7T20_01805 [Saprospiraceae bacterium]|nr:hypothetical protein [Saprospiraceae bacterium]
MKLPILLKSLQPEEYKDFEKFLQSPFFKASEQYLKYFRHLCKQFPSLDLGKAELQSAYKQCFGQQSLTDSKLYNLLSGLSRQIELYLVVRQVMTPEGDNGGYIYHQLLVESLGKRNLGAYFRSEAQALMEEIEDLQVKGSEDYYALNKLNHAIYYNPDTPKYAEHPPYLQLALEHLDLYYFVSKLRYAAEMKARERILNVQYEIPLLEALLAHTAAPVLQEAHPLLAVYHRLVRLYLEGVDEPGFRDLMQVYTDKRQFLPKTDHTLLMRHLINCGIALNTRNVAIEAELLSLYKLAIETDTLLDGKRLTDSSFINIVYLAGFCREFDWAKAFIIQFSPYLEDSKRQPSMDLVKAILYYNEGRLDEAQESLSSAIFQIPNYEILGRTLLIKIIFDRYINFGEDYEFLSAQIKAFERYVQIKQFTADKKESYLNWIKFLRKMQVVKFEMVNVPASKKEALRKKLEQLQPIVSKKWLEEKIEAL